MDSDLIRAHDILKLRPEAVLDCMPWAPEWVEPSLAAVPFVTVRRAVHLGRMIAVGVRGMERGQRWATCVDSGYVENIIRPPDLLARWLHFASGTWPDIAAFRQLGEVFERWRDIEYSWGPCGSVGFAFATGMQCVGPLSDLDLVVYVEKPIDRGRAIVLQASLDGGPARVDAIVETPSCGFSLKEYATRSSCKILVRIPTGRKLQSDPWSPDLISDVT